MPTAATLLMIASVLGAPDNAADADASEATTITESAADAPSSELEPVEAETAATTGAGDPLYDRLFAEKTDAPDQDQPTASVMPQLPPWLWVLGMAGLGGLYYLRKRKVAATPQPGQVEVLGHTRMGSKAKLTVIRVEGEDGRKRRLLVSTGEGTPTLVADLGAEGETPQDELATLNPPLPTVAEAAPIAAPFHAVLDQAVEIDEDILDDDEELLDGDGLGQVPPPKVAVWNEPPPRSAPPSSAPTTIATRPATVVSAPPAPPTLIERLDDMLGAGDAPEMVMDVSWDADTGWSGLQAKEPTTERTRAPAARLQPEPPPQQEVPAPPVQLDPADSWEHLLQAQALPTPDPLEKAGLRPASRAAFETLLTRGGRQVDDLPRSKRVRPVVHTVKPLRPRPQSQARRTPYDEMIVEDEPIAEPTPIGHGNPRSPQEVHDLVAEVLNERDDGEPKPATSGPANGVVELARYLRRQVSP